MTTQLWQHEIIFFLPYQTVPCLWKDCPRLQTDSKDSSMLDRKCLMPLQYGPQSLLLEACTCWLGRKGTHHEMTLVLHNLREDMRKWGGKPTLP